MKAIITVGISASGKSTFAGEWVACNPATRVEVNRDYFRILLMSKDGGQFSWNKWNWKNEKDVTSHVNIAIENAARNKRDIIISDTNLNRDRRIELGQKLERLGYDIEIKDFPVSLEEAWKRDAARGNGVGHSVIAKQYNQWLEYTGENKKYEPNAKQPCILVDVDGTLAHMNGKRNPFEWDKVRLDDVDENVKAIVNAFHHNTTVIILSGRDGCCRELTKKWLTDNDINHDLLFMRAADDMRKDTVVKEELFWQNIAPNYNVLFAIDDRPCVVRLWQKLGIKTFAVGNPWIEF